jgi:hypothetical protein
MKVIGSFLSVNIVSKMLHVSVVLFSCAKLGLSYVRKKTG